MGYCQFTECKIECIIWTTGRNDVPKRCSQTMSGRQKPLCFGTLLTPRCDATVGPTLRCYWETPGEAKRLMMGPSDPRNAFGFGEICQLWMLFCGYMMIYDLSNSCRLNMMMYDVDVSIISIWCLGGAPNIHSKRIGFDQRRYPSNCVA